MTHYLITCDISMLWYAWQRLAVVYHCSQCYNWALQILFLTSKYGGMPPNPKALRCSVTLNH